jgi:transcriptional regulator with XRE-family HTH domain
MKTRKKNKAKRMELSKYSVGSRVGYLRQKRDYTQKELAIKSGLSQATIALIENDKKDPSIKSLSAIANALDVHIAILFADESVHVFDMKKLKKKYKSVENLNDTLYRGLGEVVRFAKEIGYI